MRRPRHLAIIVLAIFVCALSHGQAPDISTWIAANYAKSEIRIPMRDGVQLFTAIYTPIDASTSRTYPILMRRTPYGIAPYGNAFPPLIGPSEAAAKAKFIFVYQDVRGAFMSEGEFMDMRPEDADQRGANATDESTDTYDTIDYLVHNAPFNNGRVGIWGISYSGFYAAAALIHAHPALKAVSPQASIADWFLGDDFHHNGAFLYAAAFEFFSQFGQPRSGLTAEPAKRGFALADDGFAFYKSLEPLPRADQDYLHNKIRFWNEMMQHPNYDAFWKARNLTQHLDHVKPAVLIVGGWFDAEDLYGPLHTFQAAVDHAPEGTVRLVIGPWCHGCWAHTDGRQLGEINFGSSTSEYFQTQIELPFFEHYLKGNDEPSLARVTVFETGSNRWRTYESWPPRNTVKRTLYLGSSGTLSFQHPPKANTQFDQYISDPGKPVPYFDVPFPGMARTYMDGDNRQQGRRPDVLVYQTAPLTEDVTLAGPVGPDLHVSTSGTDADWIVKLIDVYSPTSESIQNPDSMTDKLGGYEQLVRGDVMRARFRDSFTDPKPLVPNQPARLRFSMSDVNHTFLRGHRIMIQIQSSWFPLIDLNPQTYVDIYRATTRDFKPETIRVYRSDDEPSKIEVYELPQTN
jgi:uncharacterized protein